MTVDIKVDGVENLYRRGKEYVGRITYKDQFGRRREVKELLGTTDKAEAKAQLGHLQKQYRSRRTQRVPRRGRVTVATLLDAYLDHKKIEIALGRFAETTWHRYQRDIVGKIIPTIGDVPVLALTTEQCEAFLLEMRHNGRSPRSGGRERGHAPEVYPLIQKMRTLDPPHTYSDIAALISLRCPEEAGITRHAVKGIWFRMAEERTGVTTELEFATVGNMKEMLQGAWRWGMETTPPYVDRNVWKAARTPISREPKGATASVWTPEQLGDFLVWAKAARVRNWSSWQLAAALGERRAGVVGVRWQDINFDAGTLTVRIFVKELGDPNHRIVVEYHGKTSAADGAKVYYLDRRTLASLADHRATTDGYLRAAGTNVHKCPSVEPYCTLPGYHDRGLLFPSATRQGRAGGEYLHPRQFLRQFQRAIVRYNREHATELPMIDVHALRHGWNSVATDLGVSQAVRMDRLDHTSAQTNDSYVKAFEQSKRAAQDLVGSTLFAALG